ncbi:hypothetical protein TPHA_0C00630 [Tetrapisispora phaffii CBS 4417]|uniref:Uncharacterized protein n=1 Tax=Tetrapisispora phaffii (strain ATCC 24235 / CBS 4417 / NBRC 1672 / NRRL Y-8282 / UCD 70-5) TaxID=1071381 RepID=G8BR44_TETPH|nr:hypothetical protein TPHA_0C00630 [Tetrapisispora phaffii CBS 4417]CCE62220.1 hypothetical protein TPHA_0C00630 [Tetrapisispora phaffii CBS 4417]
MSDLIQLQREYLIKILNDIQSENNLKFLIIDNEIEHLFNYIFKSPSELLNYVTAIDKIDSQKRKGQPGVDAIYILAPTRFNINCIEADFQSIPQKYKKAHIRFLPGFKGQLVDFFQYKRHINKNLASLAEAKFGFIPKESQFFQTLGIDRPLQIFFNNECQDLIQQNIDRTISSLLNLCIITGEYPIVRYSEPLPSQVEICQPTRLVKKLAIEFQEALDNYARNNQDFPPVDNPRPRAVFIITDRTLDLFSPFLHDFSYQALSYDVVDDINLITDVYSYEAENEAGEKERKSSKLLDLVDPDWVELKHQHIADANEYLEGKIKEIIAQNPLLVDRSNVKNTTDLLSVVAHLKDFDEDRRRLVLHRTLIEACLTSNHERKLALLAEMEQIACGYGLDLEGEKVKNLIVQALPILQEKGPQLTDKVRLIIIYALYRGGLIKEDFVKLLSFIGVTTDHEHFPSFMILIENFNKIGFKLLKDSPRSKPFEKEWLHDTIIKDTSVYQTSRFIPALGSILSKVITNPLLLSEEAFPYVKDKPIELLDEEEMAAVGASASANSSASLRNPRHKASWTKNNNLKSASRNPRQRFFYYILGGITHAEIKSAYDQSALKNKDVFIGSDGITTPLGFMQSVESLSRGRGELNLKDDKKLNETPPQFMTVNVEEPISHVHRRYELQTPIVNNSRLGQPANEGQKYVITSNDQSTEKEDKKKKQGKFSKLFKKK